MATTINEFFNIDDGKYFILYKLEGSNEQAKCYYKDDSPKTFDTEDEATVFAVKNLGTEEFIIGQAIHPVINVGTGGTP